MKHYLLAALIISTAASTIGAAAGADDKECVFAIARAMHSLPDLHIIKSSVHPGPLATGEMASAGATIHNVDIDFRSAGLTDTWHFICILTPNMPPVFQRYKQ